MGNGWREREKKNSHKQPFLVQRQLLLLLLLCVVVFGAPKSGTVERVAEKVWWGNAEMKLRRSTNLNCVAQRQLRCDAVAKNGRYHTIGAGRAGQGRAFSSSSSWVSALDTQFSVLAFGTASTRHNPIGVLTDVVVGLVEFLHCGRVPADRQTDLAHELDCSSRSIESIFADSIDPSAPYSKRRETPDDRSPFSPHDKLPFPAGSWPEPNHHNGNTFFKRLLYG